MIHISFCTQHAPIYIYIYIPLLEGMHVILLTLIYYYYHKYSNSISSSSSSFEQQQQEEKKWKETKGKQRAQNNECGKCYL